MDLGKRCGLDGGLPVKLYVQKLTFAQGLCGPFLDSVPPWISVLPPGSWQTMRSWQMIERVVVAVHVDRV